MVLDWSENLTGAEMPPEWMWPFADEVEEWLEDVMAQRENRYGGGGDEDEEVPLTDNEDETVVELLKRSGRRR